MQLNTMIRQMVGDDLADAVDAARERLGDDTIMPRCDAGLWLIEVDGSPVASGLTYADAIDAATSL